MANRARGSAKVTERFSTVSPTRLPRSTFDRSHSHKTTLNAGWLIPIYVDEILPGDTLNFTPAFFARMATPLKPFMDGLHLEFQVFSTPMRLLFANWAKMMGERLNPADHNDYFIPQMTSPSPNGYVVGSLSDYLTLPIKKVITHSSLFHRNYALVFNEWFRDESLQDRLPFTDDNGPDDPADYFLVKRGKRKDYITGSLPFLQKGDPVSIAIGDTAPVVSSGDGIPSWDSTGGGTTDINMTGVNSTNTTWSASMTAGDAIWNDPSLEVDLSSATSITINALRQALGIQHMLERDARGGTRLRELLQSHFGVISDDVTLQRPELLATGSTPIQVANVQQTAPDGQDTRLGDLGAYATANTVGRGFTKSFKEHCIVMCLVSVRGELSYQQHINKMFRRKTRYDFYWPDLAHLGEEVVYNYEVWSDGSSSESEGLGDWAVFGYQPRYESYRHRQSIITGQFRSEAPASLDVWHLGLDFSGHPNLSDGFISETPPVARVVAVQSEPEFLLDSFFRIHHTRPMPRYGEPGLTRF